MQTTTWIETARQAVEQYRVERRIPGLAAATAARGRVRLAEGFGHRDQAAGLPVTPDTLFGVASVTKSMAALAIMQLQDGGRLDVHQPVRRWLPELRGPNPDWMKAMTIHHFLTHTSGLPGMRPMFHARAGSIRRDPDWRRLGLVADPHRIKVIQTYQELMELMAETEYELLGPPGTCFNYSNEAYGLLQGIIERASGRPFLEYMQERILDPLGMERSTFRVADLPRMAPVTELYAAEVVDGRPEPFHSPAWWDTGLMYTNGALKSTVLDLLGYLEVYRCGGESEGGQIVSGRAIAQMTAPQVTMPNGAHYGYGLQVDPDFPGGPLIGHSGGIKGVSAHIQVAMGAGLTAAAIANLNSFPVEPVTQGLINLQTGRPWEAPAGEPVFAELDVAAAADLPGTYRSQEGVGARVDLADGQLLITVGGLALPARPCGPDQFLLEQTGLRVRFMRSPAGTVSALFLGARVLPKLLG